LEIGPSASHQIEIAFEEASVPGIEEDILVDEGFGIEDFFGRIDPVVEPIGLAVIDEHFLEHRADAGVLSRIAGVEVGCSVSVSDQRGVCFFEFFEPFFADAVGEFLFETVLDSHVGEGEIGDCIAEVFGGFSEGGSQWRVV
jgi:hypothetical protein